MRRILPIICLMGILSLLVCGCKSGQNAYDEQHYCGRSNDSIYEAIAVFYNNGQCRLIICQNDKLLASKGIEFEKELFEITCSLTWSMEDSIIKLKFYRDTVPSRELRQVEQREAIVVNNQKEIIIDPIKTHYYSLPRMKLYLWPHKD